MVYSLLAIGYSLSIGNDQATIAQLCSRCYRFAAGILNRSLQYRLFVYISSYCWLQAIKRLNTFYHATSSPGYHNMNGLVFLTVLNIASNYSQLDDTPTSLDSILSVLVWCRLWSFITISAELWIWCNRSLDSSSMVKPLFCVWEINHPWVSAIGVNETVVFMNVFPDHW